VLPDHHHDEREDERSAGHIEAFLDGPAAPPRPAMADRPVRPGRPFELDTRTDWLAAVRRESARHARYGRPASVLVMAVAGCPTDAAVDRIARGLADVIRAEARETDRALRAGPLTFRVLLPETAGRAARTATDRLQHAFRATPDGTIPGIDLHIEIATAPRAGSLEDAMTEAERRLAARAATSQGA
jgi:hypothetical protein